MFERAVGGVLSSAKRPSGSTAGRAILSPGPEWLLLILLSLFVLASGRAEPEKAGISPVSAESEQAIFGLPFAELPGPGTWYVSQPYGNSVYAYHERNSLYKSGQGMHMGLDLAAACGTEVLAIGDGVVQSVDGRGGAPPHNLMIDHSNGFLSFYGHLLERPALSVGQYVRRGEVIALSGDMYETCRAAPHLHLEIRNQDGLRFHNPVRFIDADWHSILLLGSGPLAYERDLDQPRRWQRFFDQPGLRLGGPLLNDYAKPWPSGR